jgi:hypothetical protein
MARRIIHSYIVFGAGLALFAPAMAGCISDCRDEYASQVEDCRNQFDDPDDADDLRRCIDDAKDQFDDCKDECTS